MRMSFVSTSKTPAKSAGFFGKFRNSFVVFFGHYYRCKSSLNIWNAMTHTAVDAMTPATKPESADAKLDPIMNRNLRASLEVKSFVMELLYHIRLRGATFSA